MSSNKYLSAFAGCYSYLYLWFMICVVLYGIWKTIKSSNVLTHCIQILQLTGGGRSENGDKGGHSRGTETVPFTFLNLVLILDSLSTAVSFDGENDAGMPNVGGGDSIRRQNASTQRGSASEAL